MQTSKDFLHIFLDMGDALLNSGAEIFRVVFFSLNKKAVTSQLPPSYSEKTLVLPNIYYQKEINIHDTATKRLGNPNDSDT